MIFPGRVTIAAGALAGVIAAGACGGGNETSNSVGTTSGSTSADGVTTSVGSTGGGGSGGTGGAGTTSSSTTSTTSTGPYNPATDSPQVVDLGGSIIASPKIQLIAYESDPMTTDVEAFIQELKTTSTWADQTKEYGVGDFTILPTIKLTGTPPTSLDDNSGTVTPFEKNLAMQLSGTNPAWGAADANTVYMFLIPQGTDVISGGHCCSDYLGYHWATSVGSVEVPYSIICDCKGQMGDPLTPLQYVTTTVIHEMVEAATDPYSNPAYGQADDDHVAWTIVTGGEVSDMCEYNEDGNIVTPGATYMIQRSWSDAAAKAGKNPCVPTATNDPYFNSIPVLPATVTLSNYGSPVQTKGIQIPVGSSATVDVQMYSEAPTAGPWKITAYDLDSYFGSNPRLDISFDKDTGQNGDVVKMTIKVNSKDKQLGGEIFILQSDFNGQQNISMGVVVN